MKKIINGKKYDTETAEYVDRWSNDLCHSDVHWCSEELYRKRTGEFFLYDDILNGSCLDWLERTANAKVHGTTKRIPAEVFKEEREHLRPLPIHDQMQRPVVCRTVRKDNTIIYDSNRYSVPLGTYNTQPEVRIETVDGILYIQTIFGEPICEHRMEELSLAHILNAEAEKIQFALGTLETAGGQASSMDDILETNKLASKMVRNVIKNQMLLSMKMEDTVDLAEATQPVAPAPIEPIPEPVVEPVTEPVTEPVAEPIA